MGGDTATLSESVVPQLESYGRPTEVLDKDQVAGVLTCTAPA